MPELKTVSVSILGKDYQVNCKPDEVASLMQSAQHLDKRMKEIKNGGSILWQRLIFLTTIWQKQQRTKPLLIIKN
jgi:cell division protein ZapA (FtsZ GTPase activity inhibitor)